MLVEKYKPKNIKEVAGHKEAIKTILEFIKDHKPGKALLIHGTTGIGKTLISQVISSDQNLTLLEIHSSELDEIKKLKSASTMMSLLGKKKVILIDEVDHFTERNTVSELMSVIGVSKFPIILTADNAYERSLRKLRENCEILQMRRLTAFSIIKRLKEICKIEGVEASDKVLNMISGNAHGDMRSAINDLQILSTNRKKILETDVTGFRERQISVFDAMRIIFKSNDLQKARKAIWFCEKDLEELFWWVEQNITNEFKDPNHIALAYDILSRADIFRAKANKNMNWRMLKYMNDVLASMTLVRGAKDESFTSYKPPERLIILGTTKAQRAEDDETFAELAQQMHCSKRCIKNQLPFIKAITSD